MDYNYKKITVPDMSNYNDYDLLLYRQTMKYKYNLLKKKYNYLNSKIIIDFENDDINIIQNVYYDFINAINLLEKYYI
jgi:hypothetical protein